MDKQDAKMLGDDYALETQPGGGRQWSKPISMKDYTYAAERTRTGKWGTKTDPIIGVNDVRTIEVLKKCHAVDISASSTRILFSRSNGSSGTSLSRLLGSGATMNWEFARSCSNMVPD